LVLTGNDQLLRTALENQAGGCITAMANLISPSLRRAWDSFQNADIDSAAEANLKAAREIFEAFPPAPSLLKYLISQFFEFPRWDVRAPLVPFSTELEIEALTQVRHKLDLTNS
jgi:dihydrodipicolinate synthase/N-acetylneuraminate lyase